MPDDLRLSREWLPAKLTKQPREPDQRTEKCSEHRDEHPKGSARSRPIDPRLEQKDRGRDHNSSDRGMDEKMTTLLRKLELLFNRGFGRQFSAAVPRTGRIRSPRDLQISQMPPCRCRCRCAAS